MSLEQQGIHLPPQWLGRIKLLAALVLLVMSISQVVLGIRMLHHNLHLAREVSWSEIGGVYEGDKVYGRVMQDKALCWFTETHPDDSQSRYLVALTPDNRMMIFCAHTDKAPVQVDAIEMMMAPPDGLEGYDFYDYGGYGQTCTPLMTQKAWQHIPQEVSAQYSLTADSFDTVYIDCSDAEEMNGAYPVMNIAVTFLTAVVLLVGVVLLVRSFLHHRQDARSVQQRMMQNKPEEVVPTMTTFEGYDSGNDDFKDPFKE